MTEEQPKKVKSESASDPPPPAPTESPAPQHEAVVHEATKDVTEEKSVIPQPPTPDKKPADESKALAIVESMTLLPLLLSLSASKRMILYLEMTSAWGKRKQEKFFVLMFYDLSICFSFSFFHQLR